MLKSIIFAVPLFFTLALTASAQEFKAELESRRMELQKSAQEFREKFEATRAQVKEVRTEVREKAQEFRADVHKNRAEVSVRVFNATIERLAVLVDRIESRIAKLNEAGVDTTEAAALVAEAKTYIETAQKHIANLSGFELSDDATLQAMRDEMKSAREALIEAKQTLMKAVQTLKGLRQDQESNDEPVN